MAFIIIVTAERFGKMDKQEAQQLTNQIRQARQVLSDLVIRAYDEKIWHPMGYDSWDDYCKAEFKSGYIRLPREERIKTVAALKERSMSNHAIASSLGVDPKTVRNDIKSIGEKSPMPERVNTTDGRSYPAKRSVAQPKPQPLTKEDAELEIIASGGVVPESEPEYGPMAPTEDIIVSQEALKVQQTYRLLSEMTERGRELLKIDQTTISDVKCINEIQKLIEIVSQVSVKTVERVVP